MKKIAIGGLLAVLLAACAPLPVKDISADKYGYQDKFLTEAMSADVLTQMRKADTSAKSLSKMVVSYDIVVENKTTDSKEKSQFKKFKALFTYKDAGNGIFVHLQENSQNDFPYLLQYEVSYHGIIPVAIQNVYLNQRRSQFVQQIKKFNRYDVIPKTPAENSEYRYKDLTGISAQIAGYSEYETVCKTGKYYSANSLSGKLVGNAIDFNCEIIMNNAPQSKSVYAYLPQYGVGFKKSSSSIGSDSVYTITDVKFN